MAKNPVDVCEQLVRIWDKKELWNHITDLEFAKAVSECRKVVKEKEDKTTN